MQLLIAELTGADRQGLRRRELLDGAGHIDKNDQLNLASAKRAAVVALHDPSMVRCGQTEAETALSVVTARAGRTCY